MKARLSISLKDAHVMGNVDIGDFDFNIEQEMTPEEFVTYIELMPAALLNFIKEARKCSDSDTLT